MVRGDRELGSWNLPDIRIPSACTGYAKGGRVVGWTFWPSWGVASQPSGSVDDNASTVWVLAAGGSIF